MRKYPALRRTGIDVVEMTKVARIFQIAEGGKSVPFGLLFGVRIVRPQAARGGGGCAQRNGDRFTARQVHVASVRSALSRAPHPTTRSSGRRVHCSAARAPAGRSG